MNDERHYYTRENNNNNYYTGCYLHPKQVLIGVCPLCLNERLVIIIASRKANGHFHHPSAAKPTSIPPRKPPSFPNIFRFLNPLELRYWKSRRSCASSTSQDDSFISMKFEKNGIASWDNKSKKGKVSNKVSLDHCNNMTTRKETPKRAIESLQEPKNVTEFHETRVSLGWHKRIGRLCHLINWKRSDTDNVCHSERVKVKKGCILFPRRTKNS